MRGEMELDLALDIVRTGEPPYMYDAACEWLSNFIETTKSPRDLRKIAREELEYIRKGG